MDRQPALYRPALAAIGACPDEGRDAHLKVGAPSRGEEPVAQIMASEDTWQWGRESEPVYREIVEGGPR